MTLIGPAVVYVMCLVASAICAGLLVRAFLRTRTRLMLWTAISFAGLALNNLLLVADLVFFRQADLWPYRQAVTALALGVLLVGFIWETE